jgi:hypothetical protein
MINYKHNDDFSFNKPHTVDLRYTDHKLEQVIDKLKDERYAVSMHRFQKRKLIKKLEKSENPDESEITCQRYLVKDLCYKVKSLDLEAAKYKKMLALPIEQRSQDPELVADLFERAARDDLKTSGDIWIK